MHVIVCIVGTTGDFMLGICLRARILKRYTVTSPIMDLSFTTLSILPFQFLHTFHRFPLNSFRKMHCQSKVRML